MPHCERYPQIDPDLPEARVSYPLEDNVLICTVEIANGLSTHNQLGGECKVMQFFQKKESGDFDPEVSELHGDCRKCLLKLKIRQKLPKPRPPTLNYRPDIDFY